jgi:hypothetical protein
MAQQYPRPDSFITTSAMESKMDQLPPPPPTISRPPPLMATPLEIAGIRYQQDQIGATPEKEAGAAYLAAINVQTGARLWLLKIEQAEIPSPGAPFAFNFVYLKSIAPGANANELIITTNSNTRYLVDLDKRSIVQRLKTAPPLHAGTVPLVVSDVVLPPDAKYAKLPDTLDHMGVHYRQATASDGLPAIAHSSFLAATEPGSGKVLWSVKVGEKPDGAAEAAWTAPMMAFADMGLGPGENELTIVDFAGRHYRVNMVTHASVPVANAEQGDSPLLAPLGPLGPLTAPL